jgi:selenocysteine-specific elongation factor
MSKTEPPLAESDIFNVVIGTAGHIDHGKSALVERLTGIDPDRLKEEQDRGMTVDLGFAPLTLKDGRRVGLIDVPGHERFVKNMVAGATGIDAVILVVAADDGVMPQTREHVDIMTLLGVSRGVVAITKADLVEEDLLELVLDDVQGYLAGTFLEGAPMVITSAVTGQGMDDLVTAIHRLVEEVPTRPTGGIFRMPVQRVFSAKGHGTVVTGIPVSGTASPGDLLEIQPGSLRGRVRAVQAYKRPAASARAGHSSALNLSDVDYREVRRGMVVVTPDTLGGSTLIEARLRCLPSMRRPLRHLSRVRFHSGTSEELGRLAILEGTSLGPGQAAYVQVRLDSPVVVAPGDRFVLRLHSPMVTVGGGEVLGVSRWRLKTGKAYVIERLQEKEQALGESEGTVAALVREAGSRAIRRDDLRRTSLLPEEEFRRCLEMLLEADVIVELSKPTRYLHRQEVAHVRDRILEALDDFHRREPLRLRMSRSVLERDVGADRQVFERVLGEVVEEGEVEEAPGGVRRADHEVRPTERQSDLARRLSDLFLRRRYATPRQEELPGEIGEEDEVILPVLRYLLEKGDLVDIGDGVLLHEEAVKEAGTLALEEIDREGELTVARFKDILGSTRKYIVPLLELLDARGVTVRDGNRRLKGGQGT